MRTSEAVDLLNRLTFRPGWKISGVFSYGSSLRAMLGLPLDRYAEEDTGMVTLMLSMDTMDTSYPSADGEYRQRIYTGPRPIAEFDVTGMTENELLRRVLDEVHKVDVHEDREFLRVRQPDGTWFAPLHPHRSDGEAAWYEAEQAGRRAEYYRRSV